MKRVIKFRICFVEKGLPNQMIYHHLDDFIRDKDGMVAGQVTLHFDKDGLQVEYVIVAGLRFKNLAGPLDDTICDSENSIIQQFTGIKDKNGKEIYEGDIVQSICLNNGPCTAVVGFDTFGIYYTKPKAFLKKVQPYNDCYMCAQEHSLVIGNIFENPELIKS